jgi:hypothetical protein
MAPSRMGLGSATLEQLAQRVAELEQFLAQLVITRLAGREPRKAQD